jgi:hypothetical protein
MDHEEPTLTTDPELEDIAAELRAREPLFTRPELGTDRETFEQMTSPDFWEVGASGRRYSREFCIDTKVEQYQEGYDPDWEIRDFHCRHLSGDCYLVTYTLIQEQTRVTRRSTIWRKDEDQWEIEYHQGTMVEGA